MDLVTLINLPTQERERAMPYREARIYSGAMLEIERKHCTHHGRIIGAGRKRMGVTGKAQAEINRKNAQRKLVRLLCVNFAKGDLHITLTDDTGVGLDALKKANAKFLRKLRTFAAGQGKALKYIAVLEWKAVRPHWHIVCQRLAVTPEQLGQMWGLGRVGMDELDGSPDYGWFARYLAKQAEREKGEKRWSQSKNLEKPVEPEPKVLKRKALASRPQVPKGYYVLASYRYATSYGYEGEYIVAIREDRRKELPPALLDAMEESGTWMEFAMLADSGA